jgi:hypothetical protein
MMILRVVAIGMVVGFFTMSAFADSVQDPKVIIRDPACQPPGCTPVGTNFTFGTPASGTGTLFFTNASGVNWFNLKLVESGVPANAITCITDVFASCTSNTVNGITTILLSGLGNGFTGLLAGQNFSIIFGCETGRKCDPWPGDLDFTATANVPEPGTLALLGTGLVGIVSRRKQLKLKRSRV